MIGMKLYAFLFIVMVSWVKYIDASCMKYGHSCWGAHGKRSNLPAKEIKPDDIDRWEMFRIPNEKSLYPYRKIISEKSLPQRFRYPGNERPNTLQQILVPQFPSYEDETVDKIMRNSVNEIIDDSDEYQQQKIFPQSKEMNHHEK